MFERKPFRTCPSCSEPESLGVLSAGGEQLVRRCKNCRYTQTEILPPVSKKVVYLDQLAISEIFKIKSDIRRAGANSEEFWRDVEAEVNRAYLLQQVIFPASNIHHDETIVSPFSQGLALQHEMLSGDVSFLSIDKISILQTAEFAKAHFEKRPPPILTFEVDDILTGDGRTNWLADMHITVNADWSAFAASTRANRDATASEFTPLIKEWFDKRPSFKDVLNHELKSYGSANRSALRYAINRAEGALESTDPIELFDGISHPIMDQFKALQIYYTRCGLTPDEATRQIFNYWDWGGNEHLPIHRISAHLFAALARKIASGQRRPPSKGMFNDINAISAYGPYVDAMFLDNECAQFLSERPLTELPIKAKIFSSKTGDAFLGYLRNLQSNATALIRDKAKEIYGFDT